MALEDFLFNFRTAARFLTQTAVSDSPMLNASQIEKMLQEADLWLIPSAVQGFNDSDFSFLTGDESERLTASVRAFSQIAGEVDPNGPATPQQRAKAQEAFRSIFEILHPDKYGDAESLRIGKALERLQKSRKLPRWILEFRVQTGEDAEGNPAIWVWTVIEDEAAKPEVLSENVDEIRKLLRSTLNEYSDGRWVYMRVRTASEQEPAETGSRK